MIARGDAEGTLGGDEEIGAAQADETAARAGGAGADARIGVVAGFGGSEGAGGGEERFGEGVGEEAEAGVVEDQRGLLAGEFADLVEDVAFVGGVGGRRGAFVEREEFLRVDHEAGFGGDLFAVADWEDVDAGGFELVDGGIGGVVLTEGGDEGGFGAQAGEVAGDHGGAAEEAAFFQWGEGHGGAVGGDIGGVAVLIAVEDDVADDDEGAIDDGVHDFDQATTMDVVAFAVEGEFFLFEIDALGVVVDEVGGGVDHIAGREYHAAAVGFDGLSFFEEAGVAVALVLAAFDVNIRTKRGEQINGGSGGVNVNEIDELERRQVFGTEFLRDVGAAFAFADVGVAGKGDDEDVPLLFRRIGWK